MDHQKSTHDEEQFNAAIPQYWGSEKHFALLFRVLECD
jgi:hypothetical protein